MNDMKRISIRVPSWVKDEMERRTRINWSQKVREELIKYLKKDDAPIELRQIIRGYKNLGKLNLLKALFLYAEISEKVGQPLKTNLSTMFEDKFKEIETEMFGMFEKIGMRDRYDKVAQERNFCDVLLEVLFEEGIIEDLENEVIHTFQGLQNREQIAKALWHLGLYLDENSDKTYTRFEDMQMEILFSHIFEKPQEIIQELNRLGIIFFNFTCTNEYTHKNFDVPIYSYKLILDIKENPSKYSLYDYDNLKRNFENLLSEKQNRKFLKWLKKDYDKNFFDDTTVKTFREDFNSEYGENAFDDTLCGLVNKGFLDCRYWPHRSRAGRRKSMSAHIFFNLSKLGKKYLTEIVFEKIVKGTNNKGELESMIDIMEME